MEEKKILHTEKHAPPVESVDSLDSVEEKIKKRFTELKKNVEDSKHNKEIKDTIKDTTAGIDALKAQIKHEKIFSLAEKFKSELSVSHLLMLEDIVPGSLKKLFTKEAEGARQEIDFGGNHKAESIIGLGDMLDVSQTYVCVYDARSGQYEYGVRSIKNTSLGRRPAYTDMKTGKYIEIFDGYRVEEVSKETVTSEIEDFNTNQKNKIDDIILDGSTEEEKQSNKRANNTAKKNWGKQAEEIVNTYYSSEATKVPENLKDDTLGALKNEISKGEGNYNSTNNGTAGHPARLKKPLSEMTIDEITTQQKQKGRNKLFAVGKYQFIPKTLKLALRYNNIPLNSTQKFTPELQEQLFNYLIFAKRPMLGAYLKGTSNNIDQAMLALAREFASVPRSNGKGVYDGDSAGNKAAGGKTRYQRIKNILQNTREKITNGASITSSYEKPRENKEKESNTEKTPYIDFKNLNVLEKTIKQSNYPKTIFVKNYNKNNKYTSQQIKDASNKIKDLYEGKEMPVLFIDNENGTVQRVQEYPKLDKTLDSNLKILKNNGILEWKLQKGMISMRDIENIATGENKQEILGAYANIRIAQEKSLGLNSVTLVMDKGGASSVIGSRGFSDSSLRIEYAKILTKEAEKNNMQVLVKHFPGHSGLNDPHNNIAGKKEEIDKEMQTFIDFLENTKGKSNITVMLGHIKITAPEWDTKGLLASESRVVAEKLRSINPNIKLITDDIGGMKAASSKARQVRKNAQAAGIQTLN